MDDQTQPPTPDQLYTLTEAARLTGLSTEAIRRRAKRGRLFMVKGNDGFIRVRLASADRDAIRPPEGDQTPPQQPEQPPTQAPDMAYTIKALEAELSRQRARADQAEARERQAMLEREEARVRAAGAEGETKALREALAEARRPAWRRWLGLPSS